MHNRWFLGALVVVGMLVWATSLLPTSSQPIAYADDPAPTANPYPVCSTPRPVVTVEPLPALVLGTQALTVSVSTATVSLTVRVDGPLGRELYVVEGGFSAATPVHFTLWFGSPGDVQLTVAAAVPALANCWAAHTVTTTLDRNGQSLQATVPSSALGAPVPLNPGNVQRKLFLPFVRR